MVSTNSSSGCGGAAQSMKITVNPAPMLNSVADQTICSGQKSSEIKLSSSTANVKYNWNVVSGTAKVTGVNVVLDSINVIPAYTLSHNEKQQQVVKILAFAKTSGLAVCSGKKDTLFLKVNPIPELLAIKDTVPRIMNK